MISSYQNPNLKHQRTPHSPTQNPYPEPNPPTQPNPLGRKDSCVGESEKIIWRRGVELRVRYRPGRELVRSPIRHQPPARPIYRKPPPRRRTGSGVAWACRVRGTHLDRALIFLLFRLNFLILFLRHLSRILQQHKHKRSALSPHDSLIMRLGNRKVPMSLRRHLLGRCLLVMWDFGQANDSLDSVLGVCGMRRERRKSSGGIKGVRGYVWGE